MTPKTIKKLGDKKYRNESGLFIVEGEKNIKELLNSDFSIEGILGTTVFLDSILPLINAYDERMETRIELKEVKQDDLEHAGTLMTNASGIAVVKQKESSDIDAVIALAKEDIVLMLDDVRDPGNLGTIIRIADWFGVKNIIASRTTTDFYNPKVISATMGSFTRIGVHYTELANVLEKGKGLNIPVIVADMQGVSTHEGKFPKNGFLLMGSESHGVSDEALEYATHRVTIPRFGGAESLNVSVATGIILDSIRRN
jgi:TrmH family RNA methyltransferase